MDMTKDTLFDIAATSEQGCEEFLKQEIEQRFKVERVKLEANWVTFKATQEAIAQIMYSSQAIKRITLILSDGTF